MHILNGITATDQRVRLAAEHPLDFTIQYPPRREYFQDYFKANVDLDTIKSEAELLLYLHIPFCQAKCYFCNFAVDVRTAPEIHQRYTDLLCEQIKRVNDFLPDHITVPGVDIGGGTPTLLKADQLEKILTTLSVWNKRYSIKNPLSIETTPRIAAEHPERLDVLYAGGVTRISMGVQSINAATIKSINRGAQENMTEKAFKNLRAAKFDRINADIIFGLPEQTDKDWQENLSMIVDTDLDSVTTYDCLYRGKGRALTKRTKDKPAQETYGRLYDMAFETLTEHGFHADYGSVNFSRHNGETGTSPYFERRLYHHMPYLGLGNYASSMVGDYWWFAPYGVNQWMKEIETGNMLPQGDGYMLPQEEMMAKQILLSLNFGTIDTVHFENRFGVSFESAYEDKINYALQRKWLYKKDHLYAVKNGQFSHMPEIRALFYTDSTIEWLTQSPLENNQLKPKKN